MISSEAAPFAKSGGLGDVLGALPQALSALSHDVRVILPKYGLIEEKFVSQMEFLFYTYVPLGWRNQYAGVFSLKRNGVTYYFIDNEYYFGDKVLYRWDDLERFSFFDKACLEILPRLGFRPDVIHCHDWQAGAVPVMLKAYFERNEFYRGIKTVFTIHNLKYQGVFGIEAASDFLSLGKEYFTSDKLEFHGAANLMKGGIVYSDSITTVSPTYAEEIKTPEGGEGLFGLLSARRDSLRGILNGIDYDEYSPQNDPYISMRYSYETINMGKKANKEALQKELGLSLDPQKPMLGLVARLVDQKGIDIIKDAMNEIVNMDIQLVILGTGDERYEKMFRYYGDTYKNKISANIMFNEGLARKIYAASDIFLMPSLFEPCGLGQIIAMSYGAVPLVRETGGLKDTVFSFNEFTHEGNGFSFYPPYAHDFLYTLRRAIGFYKEPEIWSKLSENAMMERFSWENSAKEYEKVYMGN